MFQVKSLKKNCSMVGNMPGNKPGNMSGLRIPPHFARPSLKVWQAWSWHVTVNSLEQYTADAVSVCSTKCLPCCLVVADIPGYKIYIKTFIIIKVFPFLAFSVIFRIYHESLKWLYRASCWLKNKQQSVHLLPRAHWVAAPSPPSHHSWSSSAGKFFYHRLSSVCREVHFQLKQTRKPRDAIGTDQKSNLKKIQSSPTTDPHNCPPTPQWGQSPPQQPLPALHHHQYSNSRNGATPLFSHKYTI